MVRYMMPASRGQVVVEVQFWDVAMMILKVLTLMLGEGCENDAEDDAEDDVGDGDAGCGGYAEETRMARERFVVDHRASPMIAVDGEGVEREVVQVHDATM